MYVWRYQEHLKIGMQLVPQYNSCGMFVFRVITINLGCSLSVHICALRSHIYIICIVYFMKLCREIVGLLSAI